MARPHVRVWYVTELQTLTLQSWISANSLALTQICKKSVERLARQVSHEASRSHGALSFNKLLMGLNQHEPCPTASIQHSCLRIGEYRDLMCYATPIVLLSRSAAVGYCMYDDVLVLPVLQCLFLRHCNCDGCRKPGDDFSLRWKGSRIQRSMNDVPATTSTARSSTSPDLVGTCRSPMQSKMGTIISTYTTSRLAVGDCGHLIVLTDFLHVAGKECPFTKFWASAHID